MKLIAFLVLSGLLGLTGCTQPKATVPVKAIGSKAETKPEVPAEKPADKPAEKKPEKAPEKAAEKPGDKTPPK